MSTLAERIQEAMMESGLKQIDFANQVEATQPYVSRILNGQKIPSDRMAKSMARVLSVNYEWLVNGTGPKKPDLSREEEIAEVVATILKEEPGSTKERIIKVIASLTYEEMLVIEKIIDQLTNK